MDAENSFSLRFAGSKFLVTYTGRLEISVIGENLCFVGDVQVYLVGRSLVEEE